VGLHIIRRGAGYRWRRRVPKALVGLLGQDHMSASLRTTDRPMAQRLALRLSVATDEMFERLRTMPRQAKIEQASKDEVRRMDAMIRDLLRTPGAAVRILEPRSRPTTSKARQEADGTAGSPDPLPDPVHVGAVDRDDPADEGGGLAKAVVSGVARRVAHPVRRPGRPSRVVRVTTGPICRAASVCGISRLSFRLRSGPGCATRPSSAP
jgi:hypothetical protein